MADLDDFPMLIKYDDKDYPEIIMSPEDFEQGRWMEILHTPKLMMARERSARCLAELFNF